ncbi:MULTISPECIES: nucleotidyl transferase AbiEii/AbiGii toxin family protein [Carboxydocella]|uniref:nucleotidyl transferase AbiEii/AbiGii toxin family protein n=1 Tax=Carboxydocella TaxID=178898 RepID=UPI00131CAE69|nr:MULTISPECIES: nucleotidyl transferase AbiEii/AbiGii toxin family protein [Carboxydocella]
MAKPIGYTKGGSGLFEHIMSKERYILLEQLARHSLVQTFYLAGGTGAALYLGHRWSEDLDFFSEQEFDPFQLAGKLANFEGFLLTSQGPGTLHCFIYGVKVSFLYYPYPRLETGLTYKNIQLASLKDIALMKLVALVQRGTKKDFVDLFFLDKEQIKFEDIFKAYPDKYPVKTFQPLVFLKSLGYFDDAELEPMPRLFREVSWSEIKKYFLQRQKELTDYFICKDTNLEK